MLQGGNCVLLRIIETPPEEAALDAYFNAMLTNNVHLVTGFADSNSDSTDPLIGFDTLMVLCIRRALLHREIKRPPATWK